MPLPRRNDPSSTFRNLDWPTILIYLIMVLAGMVSIYAASYDFDEASMFSADEFSGKQLRWIGLAYAWARFCCSSTRGCTKHTHTQYI